jgi:hypothetical protein
MAYRHHSVGCAVRQATKDDIRTMNASAARQEHTPGYRRRITIEEWLGPCDQLRDEALARYEVTRRFHPELIKPYRFPSAVEIDKEAEESLKKALARVR